MDENVATDVVVYTAAATDEDTDTANLTYSLGTGGDNDLFDIDATSGEVTFKASPDHETPGDGDQGNNYVITVIASDGTHQTS